MLFWIKVVITSQQFDVARQAIQIDCELWNFRLYRKPHSKTKVSWLDQHPLANWWYRHRYAECPLTIESHKLSVDQNLVEVFTKGVDRPSVCRPWSAQASWLFCEEQQFLFSLVQLENGVLSDVFSVVQLRVLQAWYSQRMVPDRISNPHGEHAEDLWMLE